MSEHFQQLKMEEKAVEESGEKSSKCGSRWLSGPIPTINHGAKFNNNFEFILVDLLKIIFSIFGFEKKRELRNPFLFSIEEERVLVGQQSVEKGSDQS